MRQVGVEELVLGSRSKSGRDAPLGPDWVDVLRDIPLFAPLSKRQVRRIANLARPQRFAPESTIVRKGQRGETFYVILDGEAALSLPNRKARTLKAGDFVGELALFDGKPRSATVTAKTPLLAMRIARRPFLKLVSSDSDLALGLLKGLSERLRAADAGVE
ncbi:MAG TPA: cyclic nucleotide-binding domain-containing protein [Gaiellaceae bacterium]|nr:cyclic nucleotide-binding domain-containing protein [Gaiellaceae bacterium]